MAKVRPFLRGLLFAITLLCAVCSSWAQNSPTTLSTLNGVNESDLTVTQKIPIFHKSGRGLGLNLDVMLYPVFWKPVQNQSGQTLWTPSGGTLGGAAWGGRLNYTSTKWGTCSGKEVAQLTNFYSLDTTGSAHYYNLGPLYSVNSCGYSPTSGDGYAVDGSGLHGVFSSGSTNEVVTPDGTVSANAPTGYSLTDSNGNQLLYSTDGTTATLTDTLGKAALAYTPLYSSQGSPITYTYHGPNGDKQIVVHYVQKTLATAFGCANIFEAAPVTTYLPSDVTYPDGTSYTFTYEHTSGQPSTYTTGRLATVTQPSGGIVVYGYPGSNDGYSCSSQQYYPTGYASQVSVTMGGGTTNYSRSAISGAPVVTTVTGPNGEKAVDTFAENGLLSQASQWLLVQTKKYNGSAVSLTIDNCYDGHPNPCTSYAGVTDLTSVVTTETLSGGQSSKIVTHLQAGSMLPLTVSVYDFGNVLKYTKTVTYGSWNGTTCVPLGNYIVSAVCEIKTTDAGNNPLSDTLKTYDEGGVAGTVGTPSQQQVTGSRGNVTTVSKWVSGTKYLTAHTAYFDTGLAQSTTEINGTPNATVYAYGACGNSFVTSVTRPLSSLSESTAWDSTCNGAVPVSETDYNGKGVSTQYNDTNFWRPTSVTDENGVATSFSYLTDTSGHPNGMESTYTYNSGASVLDHRLNADAYGRTVVEQTQTSPGTNSYNSVQTVFDTSGRISSVSNPYPAGAGGTGGSFSTVQYDAMGRGILHTDVLGGTVSTCFYPSANGGCAGTSATNDTLITLGPAPTGETVKQKQYEYDALGRLKSVCELVPSGQTSPGTCGQTVQQSGWWTVYSYDVFGNLLQITQDAQATGRSRQFTYDGLGRKLTESNPESGLTQFFYDTAPNSPGVACANKTFAGDLVKTYDANGNTVCMEYDSMRRITAVKYPGGPNKSVTSERHYVYDAATVSGIVMQKTAGRIAEAYTGTSGSPLIDIGYSYDSTGKVAVEYRHTPHVAGYVTFNYT